MHMPYNFEIYIILNSKNRLENPEKQRKTSKTQAKTYGKLILYLKLLLVRYNKTLKINTCEINSKYNT